MTPDQALLISMLLGRALDAVLAKVQAMTDQEIQAAVKSEEVKTSMLMDEMRGIVPAMGLKKPETPCLEPTYNEGYKFCSVCSWPKSAHSDSINKARGYY